MQPNEGIVTNDTKALVKSEMVQQLRNLGRASTERWEREVFHKLTGHRRDDVDWDFEDNQAGYFVWIKSFDQLVGELVEDGYVRTVEAGGEAFVEPTDDDGSTSPSSLAYPARR